MEKSPRLETRQQYLEGPWKKISGEIPLDQDELSAFADDLDMAYGRDNWFAQEAGSAGQYDILVSPDSESEYAIIARKTDEKNAGSEPNPSEAKYLRDLAIEESKGLLDEPDENS